MATVTGLTAERMIEIEDASIISGAVNGSGDLILTNHGGDDINAGHVVGAQGPDGVGPTGVTVMFVGTTAPAGWLICDGSAVSRTTYAALFAVTGTMWGAGNGTSTFNLPDFREYVPVGYKSGSTEFGTLGGAFGAKTHALTSGEMPSHTHTQTAHTHVQDAHTHTQVAHTHAQNDGFGAGPANAGRPRTDLNSPATTWGTDGATAAVNNNTTATNQSTVAVNQSTGSGFPHSIVQPSRVVNFIVKT